MRFRLPSRITVPVILRRRLEVESPAISGDFAHLRPGITLAYLRADRSIAMNSTTPWIPHPDGRPGRLQPAQPGGSSVRTIPGATRHRRRRQAICVRAAEIEVTVGETRDARRAIGGRRARHRDQEVQGQQGDPRGAAPVMIEFTATEAGRFPIVCSEYCGDGHDDMKGTLVVKARDAQAP